MTIQINGTTGISGVDGSAATPALQGTDSNTGIHFPAADTVAIDTGGSERLRVDSSGRCGIGTSSPRLRAHIRGDSANAPTLGVASGSLIVGPNDNDYGMMFGVSGSGWGWIQAQNFITPGGTAYDLALQPSGGRVLVGTSTARTPNTYSSPRLQIEATSYTSAAISIINNENNNNEAGFVIGKSRGTSVNGVASVGSGDTLGQISFQGADGTNLIQAASIKAEVDGTPGANDMPGRLVFSVTSDGSASPTERARITSGGYFKATENATYRSTTGLYHELNQAADNNVVVSRASNASFTASTLWTDVVRAANSAYTFFIGTSGDNADTEFKLRGDGTGLCDGSWTGGGADYAEYFEWSDGNPDEEDRRGISVVLDGDQIRPTVDGEDPIGVISGNPSVVGDAAWNKWSGKYLRDDYGSYILDENGDRQLNPAYDPDQEYVNREQRPEWDCVGLMGKLRIRKGQPTGSRWIKMRDISDSVEEWLVR